MSSRGLSQGMRRCSECGACRPIGMLVFIAYENVRCLLLEKRPPRKTTADEPEILTCFCDGIRRRALFEIMTGLEHETRDRKRKPVGARL